MSTMNCALDTEIDLSAILWDAEHNQNMIDTRGRPSTYAGELPIHHAFYKKEGSADNLQWALDFMRNYERNKIRRK